MRKSTLLASSCLFATLLGSPFMPSYAQPVASDLPEMGDSSGTTLSLKQELALGRAIKKQRYSDVIIKDPIVEGYIEGLGHSLSSAAITDRNHFDFFVTNEPRINAFALPGGYIGVHARTILASHSESELAAVLAHEIAHVTQHHIARSIEKINQMNLPMTAAMIAAILLSGGDPQVSSAAIMSSQAGSTQMAIDTIRANEKEADRVGMQLLAAADFDPRGMGNFFGQLQTETRYNAQGAPEFLRTHPVTTRRLAEAEDRARQYPLQLKDNSIHYDLVKARLRMLMTDSPETLLQEVQASKPGNAKHREAKRYLNALLLEKLGETKKARTLLESLLKQHPERIAYIYELAQLESGSNQPQRASQYYQQGLKQYPGNILLTLAYSRHLLNGEHYPKARTLLEDLLRDSPENAKAYQLLAELEAEDGNKPASYLAQAEYFYLIGEPHSAIDQLNTAKRFHTLPNYYESRIDARLEQIKDEIERHKPTK